MTPEQQRLAIAEACGWVRDAVCFNWKRGKDVAYRDGDYLHYRQLPDYPNDLNAMHEAEKAAFDGHPDLWQLYLDAQLERICEAADNPTECATARQRAEAFLRTIGKWVES